jgi:uncharacterized protein (DUF2252 family)
MKRIAREERRAQGRQARTRVARVAHASWDSKLRKEDPIDILSRSEKGRVPKLLPEKHKRMSVSPFAYYRGSAPAMAEDLSLLPNTGLISQLCGDAHVYNLGSFTAPDGRIVFDLNDFDETIPGPFEWDVKRMAASLVLVGRESGTRELQCKDAVLTFVRSYRETMRLLSEMPVIEMARYLVLRHPKNSPIAQVFRRAQLSTGVQAFRKLAETRGDTYRFKQDRVAESVAAKVKQSLHDYSIKLLPERRHFFRQYQLEDVGFRVVGCGSVGMRDYVVLFLGAGADDPLLLQVKEETHSTYASYLPDARVPENQGQRVAEGQRALQLQSDIFLGWTSIDDRDYLVRQLRDHKASITDEDLKGDGLRQYAIICGELLAKGHARSGDPCAIFGYMGSSLKVDKGITKFAVAYADQITKDWERYKRSMRTGRKAGKGKKKNVHEKRSTKAMAAGA